MNCERAALFSVKRDLYPQSPILLVDELKRLLQFCVVPVHVLGAQTLPKRLIRNTTAFVCGHVLRLCQVSRGSTYLLTFQRSFAASRFEHDQCDLGS